MRTAPLRPAALAVGLFACSLAALPAAAQSFVLAEPVLVADGRRVAVQGAPLRQDRFDRLVLHVPGVGTYTIADQPFEGARRAGEFDGAGLFFATDGISVRLRGREPLLGAMRRDAWVRSAPSSDRAASGARCTATVSLASMSGTAPMRPGRISGPDRAEPRTTDQPLRAEVLRLRTEVARLAAEREQAARQRDGARRELQIDLDRVTAERDALRSERDRAVVDRQRLAQNMERTRQEAERARDQGRNTAAEIYTRDLDALRSEVVARDNAIATLTAERDERGQQVARLTAEVERLAGALATARTERDDARTALAAAQAAPEASGAEIARLQREADRLGHALAETRAERDRLAEMTLVQPEALGEGEARIDALTAELATVRAQLAATAARLRESEEARLALQVETDQIRADRNRLASGASGDAAELRAERDRLRTEVATLRAEVERLRQRPLAPTPPAAPIAPTPPRPPEAPRAPSPPIPLAPPTPEASATVMFPGFDFGRLANPDDVQQRMDAATIPAAAARSGVSGDVLVLFQTDPEGNVIRTAVPRPIGGGLDGLAEDLVRSMRFRPPTVDGQATGLRSQVVVRYTP